MIFYFSHNYNSYVDSFVNDFELDVFKYWPNKLIFPKI